MMRIFVAPEGSPFLVFFCKFVHMHPHPWMIPDSERSVARQIPVTVQKVVDTVEPTRAAGIEPETSRSKRHHHGNVQHSCVENVSTRPPVAPWRATGKLAPQFCTTHRGSIGGTELSVITAVSRAISGFEPRSKSVSPLTSTKSCA